MTSKSKDVSLDQDKDMKVSVPVWQHLLLHELKVLTDQNISGIVERALVHEFQRLAEDDGSPVSHDELHGGAAGLEASSAQSAS